jgi:hypothetical protein
MISLFESVKQKDPVKLVGAGPKQLQKAIELIPKTIVMKNVFFLIIIAYKPNETLINWTPGSFLIRISLIGLTHMKFE